MSDLLKRLEIIQNAVILGDEDIIILQARRLPETAAELTRLLENKEYADAAVWIANYRQNNLLPSEYTDPELSALRMELESLESALAVLTSEKAECERQIAEFIAAYMQEVGPILEEILLMQMQQEEERAKAEGADEEDDEDLQRARSRYEEFHQQKEEQSPPVNLSDDEKKELKDKYRKTAMICHPDRLPDERKEEGKKLFQELEDAYRKQDIDGVHRIWGKLQDGDWTAGSVVIADKTMLRCRIADLRQTIATLKADIAAIREDETWRLIESLAADDTSWDAYFAATKKELEEKLAEMKSAVAG